MKTTQEIIATAKKEKSYTNNLNREFSEKQQATAKRLVPSIIEQCQSWTGKENEEDSFSPFDKLARALGRARM